MGQKLNCIIIEDEPIAAEIMEDYIAKIPFLKLVATCPDAIFGLEILQEKKIDVLFLDIHLPQLSGLSLLKSLSYSPQTIITSAYKEYALDAFDVKVVDYLYKPIAFERFLTAVNRLQRISLREKENEDPIRSFKFFQVDRKMVKIYFDQITYIESLKDYVRIHTQHNQYVVRGQIGQMEEQLDQNKFIRVHRSYIVSLDRIQSYDMNSVVLNEKSIPIGRTYKLVFNREINKYKGC